MEVPLYKLLIIFSINNSVYILTAIIQTTTFIWPIAPVGMATGYVTFQQFSTSFNNSFFYYLTSESLIAGGCLSLGAVPKGFIEIHASELDLDLYCDARIEEGFGTLGRRAAFTGGW